MGCINSLNSHRNCARDEAKDWGVPARDHWCRICGLFPNLADSSPNSNHRPSVWLFDMRHTGKKYKNAAIQLIHVTENCRLYFPPFFLSAFFLRSSHNLRMHSRRTNTKWYNRFRMWREHWVFFLFCSFSLKKQLLFAGMLNCGRMIGAPANYGHVVVNKDLKPPWGLVLKATVHWVIRRRKNTVPSAIHVATKSIGSWRSNTIFCDNQCDISRPTNNLKNQQKTNICP